MGPFDELGQDAQWDLLRQMFERLPPIGMLRHISIHEQVAALTTESLPVVDLDSNYGFLWTDLGFESDGAFSLTWQYSKLAAAQNSTAARYLTLISDSRLASEQPAGPMKLPVAVYIPPSDQLTFTATDLSNGANDIWLTLLGMSVRRGSVLDRTLQAKMALTGF